MGVNGEWKNKRLRDLTLEDAINAMTDGFYCICSNGGLSCLTNDSDVA